MCYTFFPGGLHQTPLLKYDNLLDAIGEKYGFLSNEVEVENFVEITSKFAKVLNEFRSVSFVHYREFRLTKISLEILYRTNRNHLEIFTLLFQSWFTINCQMVTLTMYTPVHGYTRQTVHFTVFNLKLN